MLPGLYCIFVDNIQNWLALCFFCPPAAGVHGGPRFTSLSRGDTVSVSWLYVGANDLFDIYLRQNGERVSDNLCAGETDGSCRSTSPVASATVTLPTGIESSADYRLLVSFNLVPCPRTRTSTDNLIFVDERRRLMISTKCFVLVRSCFLILFFFWINISVQFWFGT